MLTPPDSNSVGTQNLANLVVISNGDFSNVSFKFDSVP